MVNPKNLLLLFSILCISSVATAGAYRYTDENGQTVYSQNPPADRDAARINPPPPPASSAPAEKAAMEKTVATDKANVEKAKEAQKEIDTSNLTQEEMQTNCQRAKKYLGELQLKGRIKLIGPDGQATMLSEEQKNAEIAKTQGMVKSYCKQPTI